MNGFVSEDKGIGYPQEWTVVKQVQHHRALTLTMVMRGGDAFTRLCVTHQEGTHQLQPLHLRCANFNNHETSPRSLLWKLPSLRHSVTATQNELRQCLDEI